MGKGAVDPCILVVFNAQLPSAAQTSLQATETCSLPSVLTLFFPTALESLGLLSAERVGLEENWIMALGFLELHQQRVFLLRGHDKHSHLRMSTKKGTGTVRGPGAVSCNHLKMFG